MTNYRSYNNHIYERIKEEIEMEQVLSAYGFEIKKQVCTCPFHTDTKPSMRVYKNSFYCFSCGTGGDVVKFVALYLNISNFEAAKIIAKEFGIRVEINSPIDYAAVKRREIKERKKREFLLWIENTRNVLCDYHRQLLADIEKYRPKTKDDEIDERFIFDTLELEKTCQMLDGLSTDNMNHLILFHKYNSGEVENIERRARDTGYKKTG